MVLPPVAQHVTPVQPLPGPPAPGAADIVVVVPVFNEGPTVLAVLDTIEQRVQAPLLVVDDGSTDGSAALLDEWSATSSARVLHLTRNCGKSAALRAAWQHLRADRDRGVLDDDTLVICLDADGQHDLDYLPTLIERAHQLHADAVIARREMGYHGAYKRTGNAVMAALGSIAGGMRFRDIESGYRLVRLGPLLHAQEFYGGHRYSEGVELAVVLARLGYRVDNEYEVHVPVARTRTRLRDAASHAIAMFGAWYRVDCWRDVAPRWRSRIGASAAAVLLLAFVGFLAIVLTHGFYLGNDSAQSYAHVWFIAHALWSGAGIPLRMTSLEAGQAFTFPYALLPWLPTALVRPLLGDWAVTASMIIGVGLLAVGLRRWLPRLASPLLLGAVLLNWQLWHGILQFQLPTIWAFAFACLAAAEFDRGRSRRGTALAIASMLAHPVMGAAGLLITALARIEQTRQLPLRRIGWMLAAGIVVTPAWWMFLRTPAMGVTASWALVTTAEIMLQRTSMLWWPWLCQRLWPVAMRWHAPVLLLGTMLLIRNVSASNPQNLLWRSLPRFPDYIGAGMVDPGATYRVLTMSNQEDGMAQLLQAGAVLAQEFFDESVARRSFGDTTTYRCFLASKHADRVLVQGAWVIRGTSNEVRVLDALVAEGHATLSYRGPAGTLEYLVRGAPPTSCG